MSLFRRHGISTTRPHQEPSESFHFTLDLSRAYALGTMLASSRASRVVEVSDLLAGMYIYGWERLSRYWNPEDQDRIELFLRKICRISPQRWHYWIQYYDRLRRSGEESRGWLPMLRRPFRKGEPEKPPLRRSADLIEVLKRAEAISPFYDVAEQRKIPILTSESVLLCIVRSRSSGIGRILSTTGLNVPLLERDATSSRRAPRN
jgi:hypothetical protein